MAKPDAAKGKSVGAVVNALAILRYLSESGVPLGVNQIARGADISVSTCFNILGTLRREGLISFDHITKTYAPGLGLLELASPLLSEAPADIVTPTIAELSRKHRCLICVWNFAADDRIILTNRATTPKTVRVDMTLGARLPAFAGAIGRCYAALSNASEAKILKAFSLIRWQNPPSFEEYMSDVISARDSGYGFDFERLFKGLEIAAAIVTDGAGRPRYGLSGISIAGQMSRDEMVEMGVDLRAAADRIGSSLFGA